MLRANYYIKLVDKSTRNKTLHLKKKMNESKKEQEHQFKTRFMHATIDKTSQDFSYSRMHKLS